VIRERRAAWIERTLVFVLAALFVRRGLIPAWRSLNTDFPNYYLAAKLFRGGYPLERVYDWVWFQRQKDHAGIDQPLVGYAPLSLFSALLVAPLAGLPPLEAKRIWLVVSLFLLGAAALVLHLMTRLTPRRVALIVFLAVVPLRTNFQFGQQYVVLLLLLTVAAWLYSHERSFASGSVLAVASVLKIYPVLFAVYFLRKRQWRALGGLLAILLLLVSLGIHLFGFETMRLYVLDVLPRSLRGENNGPYAVVLNSPTVLLRRLFVTEPELNPHPWLDVPTLFAVLGPLVQALILVPALWLLTPRRADCRREMLEWGAYVAVLLVFSGSATYHFCVLILPVVLAANELFRLGWVKRGWGLVLLYAAVCAPLLRFAPESPAGWRIFLGFPRLYALVAFWIAYLWILRHMRFGQLRRRSRREALGFAVLFGVLVTGGWVSGLRHARGLRTSNAGRVERRTVTLLATAPAVVGDDIYFNRMGAGGSVLDRTGPPLEVLVAPGTELFHPTVSDLSPEGWIELSSTTSKIVRFTRSATRLSAAELPIEVDEAEQPASSPDGRWLAFLRTVRGRGDLYLLERAGPQSRPGAVARERHVDGAPHDILDLGFFPNDRIVVAAVREGRPRLYAGDVGSENFVELATGGLPARYPAVSPDGAWLAYGREEQGAWQLWIMNVQGGEQQRLTNADCNSIEPAWAPDSKNLVYATDCGRGLGYTALNRIRAVP
jgi:glycosyl transferase family 87/WD40 repeat protein